MEIFQRTSRKYFLGDVNEVIRILTERIRDENYIISIKKSIIFAVSKGKVKFLGQTLESMYYYKIDTEDVCELYDELTKEGTSLLGQVNKFIDKYKRDYLVGFSPYIS